MLITLKANDAKEMKRILDALEKEGLLDNATISEDAKIEYPDGWGKTYINEPTAYKYVPMYYTDKTTDCYVLNLKME